MTATAKLRWRRASAAVVLAIGGGAIALATWTSGDHGLALGIVAFYVGASAIVYRWAGGRGDVAAIMRSTADERQRGLDRDATAITGLVLVVAAIIGAVIDIARTGSPGPYGIFCALGGVAYALSLASLRLRR